MEGPVMTSASSHRLRSSISACAQPTHLYLTSSYIGINTQRKSHESGGCFKKFNTSGRNDGFVLNKLNITKKTFGNDYAVVHKKFNVSNKNYLNLCWRCRKYEKPTVNNIDKKLVEKSSSRNILVFFPKQFIKIKKFCFSIFKVKGSILDSKKFASCLHEILKDESSVKSCKRVISLEGNSTSIISNNSNNNFNSYNTIFNSSDTIEQINDKGGCTKGKNKSDEKTVNVLFVCKKNNTSKESERSDKCSKCGVVHLEKKIKSEKQELFKWQPGHVVTRRTVQLVREIQNAWQGRVGSPKLTLAESIKVFFNGFPLSSSIFLVNEMLEWTKECPEKSSANFLSFGEFYGITNDLIKLSKDIARTSPLPKLIEKNVQRCSRKFSTEGVLNMGIKLRLTSKPTTVPLRMPLATKKSSTYDEGGMSKYEVFLGGSCNPTTWRTDFAIPELENMRISYYNPQQVEEWKPELLEVEYHAKENATVMFFVLDNQTRGVSALIEVAHLAGNQRKLILVIQSYTQKNQVICDEEISQKEYEDLKAGQEVLHHLVERQGIPVFDSIKVALKCTEKILRENLRVQDLRPPTNLNSVDSLTPREIFEKLDADNSGKIYFSDACFALKILFGEEVSIDRLKAFILKSGKSLNGTHLDDLKFDFEHFLELIHELKKKREGKIFCDSSSVPHIGGVVRDVYLGGTLENTSWRESTAIPMLKSQNLTFFTPKTIERSKRFTEVEAAAMENSFILLFVITSTARSIAAMAIAGHYIGKGANVVLCVQHLPEGAKIDDERLSESAVKDYNRGRMYLTDIAKRSGISVFIEISEAVEFVIQKCKNR